MANQKITNNTNQSIPFEYTTESGLRFRWMTPREVVVMDDSRLSQSIQDLVSSEHFSMSVTTSPVTTGFEAI